MYHGLDERRSNHEHSKSLSSRKYDVNICGTLCDVRELPEYVESICVDDGSGPLSSSVRQVLLGQINTKH